MISIHTIKSRYYSIAKQLNAPAKYVGFAMTPRDFGYPHVEVHEPEYHYVITERGNDYERRRTTDPDELLYWLISDLTWQMASDWELDNRIEGEDPRRLRFQHDIDLLSKVNAEWAERKKAYYEETLKSHPYHDRSCVPSRYLG